MPDQKSVRIAEGSTALLDRSMNRLDGSAQSLSAYLGKVVLIVNVASQCGLTKQYEGLQKLYEAKGSDGLVILGFPSNNFMGQEPGTSKEIAEFCSKTYGVTFPMFEKVEVIPTRVDGSAERPAAPLFAELTALAGAAMTDDEKRAAQESKSPVVVPLGGPTWNFTKYRLDRNGRFVARFGPRTTPDDADLIKRIDTLLATPADGKADDKAKEQPARDEPGAATPTDPRRKG